jgi:hypothetical protein
MVPFISVTDCHGAFQCRPLVSVPPGRPKVVTTPMLRVDTIVVEPKISTNRVSTPATTAMRIERDFAVGDFAPSTPSPATTVTMRKRIATQTCHGIDVHPLVGGP